MLKSFTNRTSINRKKTTHKTFLTFLKKESKNNEKFDQEKQSD